VLPHGGLIPLNSVGVRLYGRTSASTVRTLQYQTPKRTAAMQTKKPLLFRLNPSQQQRRCNEAGEVSSWLMVAAALAAAAVVASSLVSTTVTSLADGVAQSAGLAGSASSASQPGAYGFPTASRPVAPATRPADRGGSPGSGGLDPLPSLASRDLALRSSVRTVDGIDVLALEVTELDGTVTELPSIQLRSADRGGNSGSGGTGGGGTNGSDGSSGGAANSQTTARPRDALDDYTLDDYLEDRAARGDELTGPSINLAEHELNTIKDTFADKSPEIRERVLNDVRERGTAGTATLINEAAPALPQDHFENDLWGLLANSLFGFVRDRGKKNPPVQIETPFGPGLVTPDDDRPPPSLDSDNDGVPNRIDPDFNPRPGDQDGDNVPDLIDRDTQPADPFDFDFDFDSPAPAAPAPAPAAPAPAAPAPAAPAPSRPPADRTPNSDSDSDRSSSQSSGRGSTSNPGNPDNPAGEPDECGGSCA